MATIHDVAKLAGVSPSTVSYALSGDRPVSDAVKLRVADAIERLDYAPSALALNLRKGSSHTVGLVYPLDSSAAEEPGIDFIGAAAQALKDRYTLSLFLHGQGPEALVEALRQRRVDGLIVMQITRNDPRVEALRATDHPFALIGRPERPAGVSLVDYDFEQAAYLAVRHLVELGHRIVGYIDFPAADLDRDLGYVFRLQRGFRRASREFDVAIVRQGSGPRIKDGYAATSALLERSPAPTGIIALGRRTHIGVLRALHDRGCRVPADCSLIYLGMAVTAEWSVPSLTSIEVPIDDMARIGAELLLERIAGEGMPKEIILPARLAQRESTAPPGQRR